MSLAAAKGFFPMISRPWGRCQDKVAGDCTQAFLFFKKCDGSTLDREGHVLTATGALRNCSLVTQKRCGFPRNVTVAFRWRVLWLPIVILARCRRCQDADITELSCSLERELTWCSSCCMIHVFPDSQKEPLGCESDSLQLFVLPPSRFTALDQKIVFQYVIWPCGSSPHWHIK